MILAAMALSTALQGQVGQCDPIGGPRFTWNTEARLETRGRIRAACRDRRASRDICVFWDVVTIRESAGRPGVRHTLGRNEDGLGAMGLSLRWMAHLWPGEDEDPAFCRPEVSFLVAHELAWRAVTRWHASNLVEVQAVFAGHLRVQRLEDGTRLRLPGRTRDPALCRRLAARGVDCMRPLTTEDLGRRVGARHRRAEAGRLEERWSERH